MKKKLDTLTRVKLMLTIEYAIFILVFATLGVLFLTEVIKVAEWKRYAFTYITLIGGLWIIADFFWTLFSKKRRTKFSFLDKCLILPIGIALVVFDIYAITQGCAETLPYRFAIGINLCVIAAVYAFEAVFHWFHPIPAAYEAVEEMEKEEARKQSDVAKPESLPKRDDEEKTED